MKNIVILLLCTCLHAQAQKLAVFTVSGTYYASWNLPVNVALHEFADDRFQLFEVRGNERINTSSQQEPGSISWILSGLTQPNETRTYELVRDTITHYSEMKRMMVRDYKDTINLVQDFDHRRLQYHFGTMFPPAGVDSFYARSGFIHPLWAPDGQVLTNIQPKDHYHHYGIWNPWTHTRVNGREVDFWNLQKKEAYVKHAAFLSETNGNVWCGFKTMLDHNLTDGITVMKELWDVRVYYSGSMKKEDTARYYMDFTSTLNNLTSRDIELLQYRYGGGFGLRATAAWKGDNTTIITSAGKNRNNSDSTRARWVKITGKTEKGLAGMLILCADDNFDAPQPLRIWADHAEHGELMLNYSPTKMKEWDLHVNQEYRQRYRLLVFNNDLTVEQCEAAWQGYVHPPHITGIYYDPI